MRHRAFRATIATIVLSLALPAGLIAACAAGAADSPMAQMECCKHGQNDCGASVSAKACCETSDQADHQGLAKTTPSFELIRKLPIATGLSIPVPVYSAAFDMHPPRVAMFAGTTSPPRLAFSVLLI